MGFKLGGDGEEFKPHLVPSGWFPTCTEPRLVLRHHLIRSSLQGGGGKRASTDYFALKLNASSQSVIN
jgi:hypothetical protein